MKAHFICTQTNLKKKNRKIIDTDLFGGKSEFIKMTIILSSSGNTSKITNEEITKRVMKRLKLI